MTDKKNTPPQIEVVTEPVAIVAPAKPLPAETISYSITLNNKELKLENVPLKDNNTFFQSGIISVYSVAKAGEYEVEGTNIKVTVVDNE